MSMLRRNARESLTNMSRKSNIPISTIYDKIKNDKHRMIKKHTVLVDFSKLGFNTRASISLKVRKNKKRELGDYLSKHPNINNIFRINNGYDFWIECIFKDMKELEEFTEYLEERFGVKKEIYYIIDEVKRESFMSDPQTLGLETR
ncbi:MAG: Lrp/AsnC family transcriptional regulator [Nanobdellota archaeon]